MKILNPIIRSFNRSFVVITALALALILSAQIAMAAPLTCAKSKRSISPKTRTLVCGQIHTNDDNKPRGG